MWWLCVWRGEYVRGDAYLWEWVWVEGRTIQVLWPGYNIPLQSSHKFGSTFLLPDSSLSSGSCCAWPGFEVSSFVEASGDTFQ